jgi:RNA polymerase sigma-70 factor (ECF subfamily)
VQTDRDFQDFYEANYGRLVGMLTTILGDQAEAEDAAQEAFARALLRWSRLVRYDLPEAWVRRVALRLAIDTGRRRRRALRLALRLSAALSPVAPEPGDPLMLSPMGVALSRMPLTEREVIVLHYLADLPVDVIARERGLPAGTVKTRLAAGRRRLARELTTATEEVRDDQPATER